MSAELRAALDGLARSWEREATRRESDETRRDDPTNLLAMGIFRTVAQEVRAALAAPSTPEPTCECDGYGGHAASCPLSHDTAPSTEPALDAPALPEVGCGCSACAYLVRKQAEHYAARLAESQP